MSAVYRILVRMIATRGRLTAILALGGLVVFVGFAVKASDDGDFDAAADALVSAGLSLFVPVTAVVFASAVLGEMTEDGTLVYVWARPLPRSTITMAGIGASLSVALPCALLPIGIMALVMDPDLLGGALVAATLSTVAHTALFVGIGARVPRALIWALAYVALWEGIVGGVSAGIARTSLQLYSESLLREISGASPLEFGVSQSVAVAVLVGAAIVGAVLTTSILRRMDVP